MKTQFSRPIFLKIIACRNAAFSLVEVVLAVGIMALGVVTILGLLPHGMEMSRKTANEQAETRIVDQITGEIQASDWKTMSGLVTGGNVGLTKLFDDQGLEVGVGSDLLTYLARVRLLDASDSGARLPSGTKTTSGTKVNNNLRRVMVEVAVTQDPNFNFTAPPPGITVKRFTQLVPKMRQ